MQELRNEFDKHRDSNYELAVAISGYKEVIDLGYDILAIGEYVDFLSVMTYDYHGAWENRTGHLSPLHGSENDQFPEYNTVGDSSYTRSWSLIGLITLPASGFTLDRWVR